MTLDRVMPVIQNTCSATVSASCRPRGNGTEAVLLRHSDSGAGNGVKSCNQTLCVPSTRTVRVLWSFRDGFCDNIRVGAASRPEIRSCLSEDLRLFPSGIPPPLRSPGTRYVQATGLRTALGRCNLVGERPLLAGCRRLQWLIFPALRFCKESTVREIN